MTCIIERRTNVKEMQTEELDREHNLMLTMLEFENSPLTSLTPEEIANYRARAAEVEPELRARGWAV